MVNETHDVVVPKARENEPLLPPEVIFERFRQTLASLAPHQAEVLIASLGPTVVLNRSRGDLFLHSYAEIAGYAGKHQELFAGLFYCLEKAEEVFTWAKAHSVKPELIASIGHDLNHPDPAYQEATRKALAAGALQEGWWEPGETPLVFRDDQGEVALCRQNNWPPLKSLTTALTFDRDLTGRLITAGVKPDDPRLADFVFAVKYFKKEPQAIINQANQPVKPRPLTPEEQANFVQQQKSTLAICKKKALFTKTIPPDEVAQTPGMKLFGAKFFLVPRACLDPGEEGQTAILFPDDQEMQKFLPRMRIKRGVNETTYPGSHKPGALGWIDFTREKTSLEGEEIQTNLPHWRLAQAARYQDWGKILLSCLEEFAQANHLHRLTIPTAATILTRWFDLPNRPGMIKIYAQLPASMEYQLVCRQGKIFWEKILP